MLNEKNVSKVRNTQNMVDNLLEIGFLTGSRAFGTHRKSSDIDIAFSMIHTPQIDRLVRNMDREASQYFNGYTVFAPNDTQAIQCVKESPHYKRNFKSKNIKTLFYINEVK